MSTSTSSVVNARNASEVIANRWKDWSFKDVTSLITDRDSPEPQKQEEACNILIAVMAAMQVQTGLKGGVAVIVECEELLADCTEFIDTVKYHANVLAKCTAFTMPHTFDGAFAGVPFGSVIAKLFLKAGATDRRKAIANASDLVIQARA